MSQLKIRNFRGIKKADLVLRPNTLLIGQNNVGKTTVLEAVALLLGRDRMVAEPCEWDFFNGCLYESQGSEEDTTTTSGGSGRSDPDAHNGREHDDDVTAPKPVPVRIQISGVLADLSLEELRLFCHPTTGGTAGAWNPSSQQYCDRSPAEGEQSAVKIAYEAFYDSREGEIRAMRFFPIEGENPLDGDPALPVRRNHVQSAGYYFLSASRLWKDALRFTSSIFGKLLRQRGVQTGNQIQRIVQSLESLKPKAQDASEFSSLLQGLQETIGTFIPLASEEPLGFEVTELSTPDVERALTLFVRGSQDSRRIPISRHGAAAISIQLLAMLAMLGRHRKENGRSFILGLEEPELHLHPHGQRNLVSIVRKDTSQVLASTHSPAIAECFTPDEICVISWADGSVEGQYLLDHQMTPSTKNLIKRWVFRRRRLFAEALMAPAILFVEGVTESDLLPGLSSLRASTDDESLDRLGCIVVGCDGSNLPKQMPMFERFPGAKIVLVDGDSSGDGYVTTLQELPPAQQPHCLLRLPEGLAFEKAIAWNLGDESSNKVLDVLKELGTEVGVAEPDGRGEAGLAEYLVKQKLKDSDALRASLVEAFRRTDLVAPAVQAIRKGVREAIHKGPIAMRVVRIGGPASTR